MTPAKLPPFDPSPVDFAVTLPEKGERERVIIDDDTAHRARAKVDWMFDTGQPRPE